jgi:cell division protein FtsQ
MQVLKKYSIKQIMLLLMWIVLGAATIFLLLSAINDSNKQTCTNIKIVVSGHSENDRVNERDIRALIVKYAGNDFIGKKITAFRLPDIEKEIRRQPWVKQATLFFDRNGVLSVQAEFRHPVVRVFNDAGASFYADESGFILPLREGYITRIPVVSNFPSVPGTFKSSDSALLKSVAVIGNYIAKDSFLMAMIDQINLNSKHQFELLPKIGDQIIYFGNDSDLERKFSKLKLFYTEIVPSYGWERYNKINLQYQGQIVASIRGKEDIVADSVKTMQMIAAMANYANRMSGDSASMNITADDASNTTSETLILQSFARDEPEVPEVVSPSPAVKVVTIDPQPSELLDDPNPGKPRFKTKDKPAHKKSMSQKATIKSKPKPVLAPKKKTGRKVDKK